MLGIVVHPKDSSLNGIRPYKGRTTKQDLTEHLHRSKDEANRIRAMQDLRIDTMARRKIDVSLRQRTTEKLRQLEGQFFHKNLLKQCHNYNKKSSSVKTNQTK